MKRNDFASRQPREVLKPEVKQPMVHHINIGDMVAFNGRVFVLDNFRIDEVFGGYGIHAETRLDISGRSVAPYLRNPIL